jgi:hypothetical protein
MSYKLQVSILIIGIIAVIIIARRKRTSQPAALPKINVLPIPLPPTKGNVLDMTVYNLNGTYPPLSNSFYYNSAVLLLNSKDGVFSFMKAGNYLVTVTIKVVYDFFPATIYLNQIGKGPIDYSTFRYAEGDAINSVFKIKANINDAYYIYYTLENAGLVVPTARVVVVPRYEES